MQLWLPDKQQTEQPSAANWAEPPPPENRYCRPFTPGSHRYGLDGHRSGYKNSPAIPRHSRPCPRPYAGWLPWGTYPPASSGRFRFWKHLPAPGSQLRVGAAFVQCGPMPVQPPAVGVGFVPAHADDRDSPAGDAKARVAPVTRPGCGPAHPCPRYQTNLLGPDTTASPRRPNLLSLAGSLRRICGSRARDRDWRSHRL